MDNHYTVDTHGHCFACLVKLESEGVAPYFLHPLQHLYSYLKPDLDKVFSNEVVDDGEGERSTRLVQVPLCEGCQPLNGSLSELYIQLQRIRGEMASQLFRLHRKMASADETGLGELFRTLMGGDNVVEKLRKETILKCSDKLTAFYSPQIDIPKLITKKKRGRPRKLKSLASPPVIIEPSTVKMEASTEDIITPDWAEDEDMNYDDDDPDYLPEPGHSPSQQLECVNVTPPSSIIQREEGKSTKTPLLQNSTLSRYKRSRLKNSLKRLQKCRRRGNQVESKKLAQASLGQVRRGRGRPRKAQGVVITKKERDSDSEEAVDEIAGQAEESVAALSLSPPTPKRRFKCSSCDKRFTYRQSYSKHYRNCRDRNKNEDDDDEDFFPEPDDDHDPPPPSEDHDYDASNPEGQQTDLKAMESQFTVFGEDSDKATQSLIHHSTLISSSSSEGEAGRRKCNDCSEEFSSASAFTSHYRRIHLQLRYRCNVCGEDFPEKGNFQRHYRTLHLGVKFKCASCAKLFSHKWQLRKHQRTECGRGEEEEPKRKYVRKKRRNEAIRHSASSKPPLEIVVEPENPPDAAGMARKEVEVTVGDSDPQKTPRAIIPPPTIVQMEGGGAELGPVESFLNPETGRYGCLLCSKEFKGQRVFQDHYNSVHLKLRYKCAACHKTFGYPQAYTGHYRHVHVRINYKCRVCGAQFLRRSYLWKHQQEGTCGEPQEHHCPHCGKSFRTGTKLRTHIQAIHVKQHHVCDRCGKEFNTAHYLNRHIRKQHGERKLLDCPHCDKQVVSLDNLRLHLRTHTGEKPYLCQYCQKGFASGSNRNVHQRSCTIRGGGQQGQEVSNPNPNNMLYN